MAEVIYMDISYKRNIGNIDRIARVLMGIVLLYVALFQPVAINSGWLYGAGIVGILMLIEGAAGY